MDILGTFLAWTATLQPPTASFLGALSGAGLGLVAVVIGAMLNAQLNRNRDSRLRRQDRKAVAAALQAELILMRESMLRNAREVEVNDLAGTFDVFAPDPAQMVRLWPALAEEVGMLRIRTISHVVTAYGVLPQFFNELDSIGCRLEPRRTEHDERRVMRVQLQQRQLFAAACRSVADTLSKGIEELDRELLN